MEIQIDEIILDLKAVYLLNHSVIKFMDTPTGLVYPISFILLTLSRNYFRYKLVTLQSVFKFILRPNSLNVYHIILKQLKVG